MLIRILNESDAFIYQELRLSALQMNPESFGSSYDREVQFPLEMIKDRIKPSIDKFILGAFDDSNSLVGIVTFVREIGMKTNHKGNIYAMYVKPEFRRHGIGKLLILELLNKAKELNGLEQINLIVVSKNLAAKKLYHSIGFQTYGIEKHALKYNGEYFDEDFMVLNFNNTCLP